MERDGQHLLLATKLAIPPIYAKSIIARPRLYAQLDAGVQRPLTLVTASAGFGKTTLISAWLRQRDLPVAWITLDIHDNDTERFWRYMLAALNGLYTRSGDAFSVCLQPARQHNATARLTPLINALVEQPRESILILDDFHTITSSEIQQDLCLFLKHLPPHMHLVISSRTDPPFQLARLRLQERLTELCTSDLRFTSEEADAFLTQSMGLVLSVDDRAALNQRTEGWIAGLQLAALSLQSSQDAHAMSTFIQRFSGTNRNIVSYLTDEVFVHLPADTQHFLLTTSILDRMNASLCDALTGQTNGQALLDWLNQSNLFVMALDNHECWYRYYQFFADLLLHRLKREQPEHIPQLHTRASQWYEQHDLAFEAIHHALAAADWERAALLIERMLWRLLEQDECALTAAWLERLPAAIVQARPVLCYLHAWTLLLAGRISEYEQALLTAERLWQQERPSFVPCCIFDLRAHAALLRGDGPCLLSAAQQALSHSPADVPALQGSALVKLGIGYLLCGELGQAQATLEEGALLSRQMGHITATLLADLFISTIHILRGDLHIVAQTSRMVLAALRAISPDPCGVHQVELATPGSVADGAMLRSAAGCCVRKQRQWYDAAVHIQLAQVSYAWNDIAGATEHCEQALRCATLAEPGAYTSAECSIMAARLAHARSEHAQSTAWLDQAEQHALRFGKHATALALVASLRTQYLIEQDDVLTALRYCAQMQPASNEMQPNEKEAWYQAQARIHIAQDRAQDAIALLEEVLQVAHEQKRLGSEVALLVLLTLAYHAEGNTQLTMHTLERALVLAEPREYVRVFVDEGPVMTALLAEFYNRYQRRATSEQHEISSGYLYALLSASGHDIQPPTWIIPQDSEDILLDNLSEREQRVLSLIAEGLSNQDIAQKLVVTVSTIKTHLNNIYAKLHVHTRLQAVTKAYDLGLLKRSEGAHEASTSPRMQEHV